MGDAGGLWPGCGRCGEQSLSQFTDSPVAALGAAPLAPEVLVPRGNRSLIL